MGEHKNGDLGDLHRHPQGGNRDEGDDRRLATAVSMGLQCMVFRRKFVDQFTFTQSSIRLVPSWR